MKRRPLAQSVRKRSSRRDFDGPDGRYVAANPAFQKMTGYSEAELRNLSPLDITHEDDRAAAAAILAARAAGTPYPQHASRSATGARMAA